MEIWWILVVISWKLLQLLVVICLFSDHFPPFKSGALTNREVYTVAVLASLVPRAEQGGGAPHTSAPKFVGFTSKNTHFDGLYSYFMVILHQRGSLIKPRHSMVPIEAKKTCWPKRGTAALAYCASLLRTGSQRTLLAPPPWRSSGAVHAGK